MATSSLVGGAAVEPPQDASLELLGFGGSGCAEDKTLVARSPDGQAITVTYSDYVVLAGAEAQRAEDKRTCSYALKLTPPPGYSAAIANLDERGASRLAEGAAAELTVRYALAPGRSVPVSQAFEGPLDDSWQTEHAVPTDRLVFGECGAPQYIGVVSELRVKVGSADPATNPFSAVDSTDFATNHFVWRKC